jgi:hypothetical protein
LNHKPAITFCGKQAKQSTMAAES